MSATNLEDTVNTILQNAIAAASEGTEFLKGQIPEVLSQLLLWNVVSDAIVIAMCPLLFILWWRCSFKWVDQESTLYDEWKTMKCFSFSSLLCVSGTWAFISIFCALDLLKIVISPKVWLLEYAASLVHHR